MTQYFNKDGVEFKAGDKVKVVAKVTEYKDGMGPGVGYNNVWVSPMDDNIGKTFTIETIDKHGVYFVEVSLGYPITALENLSHKEQLPPELKPFQRVKLHNGQMAIVFSPTEISFEDNTYTEAIFSSKKSWDQDWLIITVYDAPPAHKAIDFSEYGDIIWESEEVKAEKESKAKQEKIAAAAAQVEAAKVVFDKASVAMREAQAALEAVK